jgi:hypothetical protein
VFQDHHTFRDAESFRQPWNFFIFAALLQGGAGVDSVGRCPSAFFISARWCALWAGYSVARIASGFGLRGQHNTYKAHLRASQRLRGNL